MECKDSDAHDPEQVVPMSFGMRIFVGIDCDEHQLMMGFIGSQGILKALSTTASLLPNHPDTFGQHLNGMIRCLRGEENLRMKQFRGIGMGIPGRYLAELRQNIEDQIKKHFDIPVYIEDRDVLAVKGKVWLEDVADMIDPRIDLQKLDLSVVYGAAKLAVDRTVLR